MDYQDYYQTLGVPRTASQAEIKKAFRKLAREHHPDAKPGDAAAEQRFKEINEANEVLSDPEKRKKYDTLGANWDRLNRAGAGAAGAGNPFAGFSQSGQSGNVRYEFRTSSAGGGDFSDFFRMFFSEGADAAADPTGPGRGRRPTGGQSFEDILRDMGIDGASVGRGDAPRQAPGARAGRPVHLATAEAVAEITLEEAFHGTTRRVEVQGKRLEVTIPRGADNGTRVKLTGQGPGRRRPRGRRPHAAPSDLQPPRRGPRAGAADHARRGAPRRGVPVTTLKGKVLLRIPAGTQNGRIFRLKGQGMPVLRKDDVGDILAKVRVVLPTNLGPEAEEAARRFIDLVDQPDPR
jgi:curved DNA-binding protein